MPFPNIRYFFILAACMLMANVSLAQLTSGLTGRPDTSYTNYSAYQSTSKSHPQARWVIPEKNSSVTGKYGLVYALATKRPLLTDVFYPVTQTKNSRTAIIIIHGGGWRSGNRTQHHALAQKLAGLGYVCFTPEYRLSTEALFPAAVYDIKAVTRWVRKNAAAYDIDPARIVALGFSAGGELAAFTGATGNMPLFDGTNGDPDGSTAVNAVVDIDGIVSFVHPESGEGDDSKRISAATYWFGYPRRGHEKLWEAGSALSYVDSTTPPTLFINSAVDRMHAGRTDYIRLLDSYHIYSEVRSFENAPHSFCLFEPWFTPTVTYIDTFLKKVFKNQ